MLISEMHYDFKVKIDKIDSLSKEDFNVAEIDWLLNEAQAVFVKQRYGGNNPLQTGFETTEKRIEDLSTLVMRYPVQPDILTTATLDANIREAELSDLEYPHLFIIRAYVNAIDPECGAEIISLRPFQSDDLNYGLKDPFNKPSADNGYFYTVGKNVADDNRSMFIHIPTGATITGVRIEYIKEPAQMFNGVYNYIDGNPTVNTDCELPEHTHREIVDLAVDIAAGIIEHPTYVSLKEKKVFRHE